MKKIFKNKKNYANILHIYEKMFNLRSLNKQITQKTTCDLRFPIFLKKLTYFTLRGLVVRKHKRAINSSISIKSYISRGQVTFTFPLSYTALKVN